MYPFAGLTDDVSMDRGGIVAGLVVGGLIFWRLWEHSETAWLIVLVLNAAMLLGMIGMAMPLGATFFFLLGNVFAQLLILFSPLVRAHVRQPSVTGLTSR
jgi:hypothetical protein